MQARWPPIARCRTMSPPGWFPGCAGPRWRPRSLGRSGGGSFETGAATPRSKLHWRRRARLNLLAALALTGDASLGGEVLRRLNAWGRAFGDTYQALNKGSHVGHAGDLGLLVRDARALAGKIRDGMP